MKFKDHFSDGSAGYSRYRPDYPDEMFEWLASQAPARGDAWDSATGSGQAAAGLARRFGSVIATDASEKQIRNAEAHSGVRYLVSLSEQAPLRGASLDLIFVSQALHWFDLTAFYAEVERVARPAALLAVCTYNVMEIDSALDEIVGAFYGDVLSDFWPPERRHVERGYRDLPFPFEEIEAPAFALWKDWDLRRLLGYVDTWSALRQYRLRTGNDPLPQFARRVEECWGRSSLSRRVTWPLSLRVGRVGVDLG